MFARVTNLVLMYFSNWTKSTEISCLKNLKHAANYAISAFTKKYIKFHQIYFCVLYLKKGRKLEIIVGDFRLIYIKENA